jgi:aryl-alcohol dehydrogenase-like predicted oxidoreductase
MEYRSLGTTGVQVSPLCLGAMMFGAWGNPDHDDSIKIIHTALDAGINFIDTADVYSAGESEEIVGKAIAGRRDNLVIATKVHGAMGRDPNQAGKSRRWIMQECENSLRRLGTDWLDLYQIHRPDPSIDIDETLGALSDLVHQGKVRYAGSSTFPAPEIVEAQWAARRRLRERFVCEQPPYSLLARLAEESGMTLVHMALAFVLQHPAVTAPIIGPRTADHLASQIGAVDVSLGADVLDEIDKIVAPGTNFSWADAGYEPPSIADPSARRRAP